MLPVIELLKQSLPETDWQSVIAALRQDSLTWQAVLDPELTRRLKRQGLPRPKDWSPASLALAALDQPACAESLRLLPLPELDPALAQRANQAFEAFTKKRSPSSKPPASLPEAGLLALALRERRRLTGKWDGLPDALRHLPLPVWQTPLACLYGLIADPLELLAALLPSDASADHYTLVLHTLLSNPNPVREQIQAIEQLLSSTQASPLILLRSLAALRPELSLELAQQILANAPASQRIDERQTRHAVLTGDINRLCGLAEMYQFASQQSQSAHFLNQARERSHSLQASLNAQIAQTLAHSPEESVSAWQQAITLDPNEPVYRAGLVNALLSAGRADEAMAVLLDTETAAGPAWNSVLARLAARKGDVEAVSRHVHDALSTAGGISTDGIPSLIGLLLDLNAPVEAAHAASLALDQQPNDPRLLALLGKAASISGQHSDASQAYQLAVLLAPGIIDFRRGLADSLETGGDFEAALPERVRLAGEPGAPASDLHALAKCALRAGDPQQAIAACQQALTLDAKDGAACAILGEAYLALNNPAKAQEHFVAATRLAPHLPRPWLALAEALGQAGQSNKAIETLRAAIQSIPGDASLQLALGEACLEADSPTQALQPLQRAAALSPSDVRAAFRLGQALRQLGHIENAQQTLAPAYARQPDYPGLAYCYARTLLDLGDTLAALAPLGAAVASGPDEAAPYLDYARTLLATSHNPEAAVNALESVLEMNASDGALDEAQALLGEALSALGDLPAALKAYQTALKSPLVADSGWRERLSLGLGKVALDLNQPDVAIAALQEAAQAAPSDARAYRMLSAAYRSAGLPNDALKAARMALHLASSDLDTLIWFAEQVLEIQAQPGEVSLPAKELQNEMAGSLTRAAQLAPGRPDLLLRLGKMQADLGDNATGAETLRKIIVAPEATPADLQQAARMLLDIGDVQAAATCLERAARDLQAAGIAAVPVLSDLAEAYRQAGNPQAALETLGKAIPLDPENACLYHLKADLLQETGRSAEALVCLEAAINHLPNDPGLRRRAALILRAGGKLAAALAHAECMIAACDAAAQTTEPDTSGLEARTLAAELARALLMPERARSFLSSPLVDVSFLPYYCLRAELALEAGADVDAAASLSAALETTPPEAHNQARILAAQARLTARRGDSGDALRIFQEAVEAAGDHRSSAALAEAALDLGEWDPAIYLARQAVEAAPLEPYTHLSLARALVRRAEFQRLCEAAGVIKHAPGQSALADHARQSFEKAITAANKHTGDTGNQPGGSTETGGQTIARWRARGRAVFQPSIEAIQALAALSGTQPDAEDVAARLAALRIIKEPKNAELHLATQAVRACGRRPLVQLQLGLLIAEENPRAALSAIQGIVSGAKAPFDYAQGALPGSLSAVEDGFASSLPAVDGYPLSAISHALAARLLLATGDDTAAQKAIGVALGLWPNEPRWQALAAEICLAEGDLASAVAYLEEAVKLEPKNVGHHLALGQALLAEPNIEASHIRRALRTVERACRMAPENVEAWLAMAHAQRQAGHLDEAVACADKAITLAPEQPEPLIMRAELALQSNDPQTAFASAQAAARLQPNQPPAALILARALKALKRPEEALAALEDAVPLADDPLPLLLERVHLLRQLNDTTAALNAVTELAHHHPDDPEVLSVLAHTQADSGLYDTAIATAQKALKSAPLQNGSEALDIAGRAKLHHLVGSLLRKSGQLDQAIQHLSEAVRQSPDWVEPYLDLGYTHQERRQHVKALEIFKQATTIAPRDPRPYYCAALAFKDGKDYPAAEAMLRRAAALSPNDVSIRRNLAAVVALNLVHNRKPAVEHAEI